jgi:hypothetical protein
LTKHINDGPGYYRQPDDEGGEPMSDEEVTETEDDGESAVEGEDAEAAEEE